MPLYTRRGDQGLTGLLGGKRVSKSDLVIEVLGTIDEADAALGTARSICRVPENNEIIHQVQTDLWFLMADIASVMDEPEKKRHQIGDEQILWIEKKIEYLSVFFEIPNHFIVPGDTFPSAMLDSARTIVRRAERRMVTFIQNHEFHNPHVLQYLNRLSSLCYALEMRELSWKEG